MSKGGSSTTTSEKQIPAWLTSALKPLLQQSTKGLAQFGAQGQNILQGHAAGSTGGPIDPSQVAQGKPQLPPGALKLIAERNMVG